MGKRNSILWFLLTLLVAMNGDCNYFVYNIGTDTRVAPTNVCENKSQESWTFECFRNQNNEYEMKISVWNNDNCLGTESRVGYVTDSVMVYELHTYNIYSILIDMHA